jgi:hypothetical protein
MNTRKMMIAVILKPGQMYKDNGGIINATSGYKGFYAGINGYSPRFDIYYGNQNHAPAYSNTKLIKNKWNLVLFSFAQNNITMKVNNEPWIKKGSYSHDIIFNEQSDNFTIGGKALDESGIFNGIIENVLLYDHVITDDEEKNLLKLYSNVIK